MYELCDKEIVVRRKMKVKLTFNHQCYFTIQNLSLNV